MGSYVEKSEQLERTVSRHRVLRALSVDTFYSITIVDLYITQEALFAEFEVDGVTGYLRFPDEGIMDDSGANILLESVRDVPTDSMYDVIGGSVKCNFHDDLESCTLMPNEDEVDVLFSEPDTSLISIREEDGSDVIQYWETTRLKSKYHEQTDAGEPWKVVISNVTGVVGRENAIELSVDTVSTELTWQVDSPDTFSDDTQEAAFIEETGQGEIELIEGAEVHIVPEESVPSEFNKGFLDETKTWRLLSESWVDDLQLLKTELNRESSTSNERGSAKHDSEDVNMARLAFSLLFATGIAHVLVDYMLSDIAVEYNSRALEVLNSISESFGFLTMFILFVIIPAVFIRKIMMESQLNYD